MWTAWLNLNLPENTVALGHELEEHALNNPPSSRYKRKSLINKVDFKRKHLKRRVNAAVTQTWPFTERKWMKYAVDQEGLNNAEAKGLWKQWIDDTSIERNKKGLLGQEQLYLGIFHFKEARSERALEAETCEGSDAIKHFTEEDRQMLVDHTMHQRQEGGDLFLGGLDQHCLGSKIIARRREDLPVKKSDATEAKLPDLVPKLNTETKKWLAQHCADLAKALRLSEAVFGELKVMKEQVLDDRALQSLAGTLIIRNQWGLRLEGSFPGASMPTLDGQKTEDVTGSKTATKLAPLPSSVINLGGTGLPCVALRGIGRLASSGGSGGEPEFASDAEPEVPPVVPSLPAEASVEEAVPGTPRVKCSAETQSKWQEWLRPWCEVHCKISPEQFAKKFLPQKPFKGSVEESFKPLPDVAKENESVFGYCLTVETYEERKRQFGMYKASSKSITDSITLMVGSVRRHIKVQSDKAKRELHKSTRDAEAARIAEGLREAELAADAAAKMAEANAGKIERSPVFEVKIVEWSFLLDVKDVKDLVNFGVQYPDAFDTPWMSSSEEIEVLLGHPQFVKGLTWWGTNYKETDGIETGKCQYPMQAKKGKECFLELCKKVATPSVTNIQSVSEAWAGQC